MSEEPKEPDGGYRSKWWRYLIIYLVAAVVVYGLIYFLFLRDGVYGS